MSPTLRPPEEVRLKRTAMSTRELRRAEVLARVKRQTLRLVDAAKMLELSYRRRRDCGSDIEKKEPPDSNTAVRGEVRTERSPRNSGGRYCSCSGRRMQERSRR